MNSQALVAAPPMSRKYSEKKLVPKRIAQQVQPVQFSVPL